MLLRSIHVENYRGLRRAELVLQSTTVLIGENDCGKSSLIEALSILLRGREGSDPFGFSLHHFHRPSEQPSPSLEPIRIALRFEEHTAGDWLTAAYIPIRSLISDNQTAPQFLTLKVEVPRPSGGGPIIARWIISGSAGSATQNNAPDLLDWLRRMNPLLWLDEGVIARESLGARQHPPSSHAAATATLSHTVEAHYAELLRGTTSNPGVDIQAGFEAAQTLLSQASRHFSSPNTASNWLFEELAKPGTKPLGTTIQKQGTAAQKLGLFLLVGAVLRKVAADAAPEAEPIVVIEDPEAHMHPMTLATVWSLIDRIKWQKIITTQSGTVLTAVPLQSIRRLTRQAGTVRVFSVRDRALTANDTRRVRYHLRSRRGNAMFARCWLLVEGETEFWLLPELAHVLGYDLASEGIACVEFAQCGLPPLLKLARELGIQWHLLTDGDQAGQNYVFAASRFFHRSQFSAHVTALAERDVEHCFWRYGYASVFQNIAGPSPGGKPARVIAKAIEKTSKPQVALQILEAVISPRSPGVPPPLQNAIEACVRLSRIRGEVSVPAPARPSAVAAELVTSGGKL